MTAAHLPGAILTPRCRGARAVAKFNAAERHGATNQIQRIAGRTANPVGQLSGSANAANGFCLAVGSAALFNAVSNAERPSHGCPVGYRDNTGCCASARYTVASTPFARALLPKALAGTRWSAMTAPHSDRQRLARFAAVLCRLPRPFSSL